MINFVFDVVFIKCIHCLTNAFELTKGICHYNSLTDTLSAHIIFVPNCYVPIAPGYHPEIGICSGPDWHMPFELTDTLSAHIIFVPVTSEYL